MGDGHKGLSVLERPSLVIAHEIGPSDVALLDRRRVLGLAEVGGRTSHSALVARGRGIPAVVGVRGIMQSARDGETGIVDGFRGEVELDPAPAVVTRYRARRARLDRGADDLAALRDEPAVTPDGHRIELAANIELPDEIDAVIEAGADGIGLFRTEFFYLDRAELPSEYEQYRAYRMVAAGDVCESVHRQARREHV